jgi:hypothetical protein
VRAALTQAGMMVPMAGFADEGLHELESGYQVDVAIALQASGYFHVQLSLVDVNFSARYVNPLWVCAPHSRRGSVLNLLRLALNNTPWEHETDHALTALAPSMPDLVTVRLWRWWRTLILYVRGTVSLIVLGPAL